MLTCLQDWNVRSFSIGSRKILKNFVNLSMVQVANFVSPLIIVPYLVRVLGPEKFGLVALAQAVAQVFTSVTDYGFNLTATSQVSIHRDDVPRVSKIFSSVISIKFLLMSFCFILLDFLLLLIPKFRGEYLVFVFSFGIVVSSVFSPLWFFQGIEEMRFITLCHLFAKAVYTIAVIVAIKKSGDYIYVPLINSSCFLAASGLGLLIALKRFGIKYKCPSWEDINCQLVEGWEVFLSSLSYIQFSNFPTIMLGVLGNEIYVGFYSACEKILRVVKGLLSPASEAVYPHASRLGSKASSESLRLSKRLLVIICLPFCCISLLIFAFAAPLVNFMLGPQYTQSVIVLRILALVPFTSALMNIAGMQTMLPLGMKRDFMRSLIMGSMINVLLVLALIPTYKHVGASISVVLTEVSVLLSMSYFLRRNLKSARFAEGICK